jgi:hypothetical protein
VNSGRWRDPPRGKPRTAPMNALGATLLTRQRRGPHALASYRVARSAAHSVVPEIVNAGSPPAGFLAVQDKRPLRILLAHEIDESPNLRRGKPSRCVQDPERDLHARNRSPLNQLSAR